MRSKMQKYVNKQKYLGFSLSISTWHFIGDMPEKNRNMFAQKRENM